MGGLMTDSMDLTVLSKKTMAELTKIAKEINCKVPDLATWYCIDEY